jgi:hypothetical protein
MSHGLILRARSTSITPFQRAYGRKGLFWRPVHGMVHDSVAVGLRAEKV